jgi:serine/threonine-protein kinase HipA
MDKSGEWSLSPAYDVGFSKGEMNHNIMAMNGKTIKPTVRDFEVMAREFRIENWREILLKTMGALKELPSMAEKAGIRETVVSRITTPVNEIIRRIERDLPE